MSPDSLNNDSSLCCLITASEREIRLTTTYRCRLISLKTTFKHHVKMLQVTYTWWIKIKIFPCYIYVLLDEPTRYTIDVVSSLDVVWWHICIGWMIFRQRIFFIFSFGLFKTIGIYCLIYFKLSLHDIF